MRCFMSAARCAPRQGGVRAGTADLAAPKRGVRAERRSSGRTQRRTNAMRGDTRRERGVMSP
jgi:hypothetical protein